MPATLQAYRQKRDFNLTSEPKGRKAPVSGDSFVIQKHAARRLHYDFRLEMNGVLMSWAVTRGPSLTPGEKRLAVHVEDHPLEYGDFEGTIPKGEYGGGAVIVWDRGVWKPVGDAARGLSKGHLEFELYGEKLGGRWHLVRIRGKPAEKRENWLLIKGDDEVARAAGSPDILAEQPRSVKTGRDIAELAGEAPGWSSKTGRISAPDQAKPVSADGKTKSRAQSAVTSASPNPATMKGARKAPLPAFLEPALASPVASPPAGERWIHEIKFDGYRLQARLEAGRVKLLTRSGLDWTKKFGKSLIADLQRLPVGTALIDGEVVVEPAGGGASDFGALQADLSEGRTDRFVYYAFDLLYLDGYELNNVPLAARKGVLRELIASSGGAIRFSDHFQESGAVVLRHACRLGLEGVVSKLRDAPYRGGRVQAWVKSKCLSRQEFVIGGFTPSSTSRRAVGSLALGFYDGDRLRHAGRVGTGFTASVAESLFAKLERMRIAESPFANRLTAAELKQLRFVRPDAVAEVEFRGWTSDGNLRHASFRGLREDKSARDIVREGPVGQAEKARAPRTTITLTHADRLYWPDDGVTKQGLADYYAEIWPFIAPFIIDRPLALLRCPEGVNGQTFFQKHAWKGLNAHIKLVPDPAKKHEEPLISIGDFDGLIALVQAAVLEIHPWGSTIAAWEQPDTIIMDLDPGEGVSWRDVIAASGEVRQRLEHAGLAAFVKTSGGKGLHVVSPIKPGADWNAVKSFTKDIADSMASDSPQRYVSTITKSKRHGKILVDYLRNQRGMTAVAAYSTRARPGAPVSMPLAWTELSDDVGPGYFNVSNAPTRMNALNAAPWEGYREAAAPIPQKLRKTAARRR